MKGNKKELLTEKRKPVMTILRTLRPGQSTTYSIKRLGVVKSTASTLSAQYDIRFTTKIDRKSKTITVTRL